MKKPALDFEQFVHNHLNFQIINNLKNNQNEKVSL